MIGVALTVAATGGGGEGLAGGVVSIPLSSIIFYGVYATLAATGERDESGCVQ